MVHGRRIAASLVAFIALALAACGGSSGPSAPAHDIVLTPYHVSLHVVAGWITLDHQDDPGTNTPYTLTLGRLHVTPGAANSTFNFQVVQTNSPDLAPFLQGLATDPAYQPIHINGRLAYVTPPQILPAQPPALTPGATIPPPQTPVAGAPGTLSHIDYVLVTPTYSYMWYTEAVAGDNADADLDAMSQSIQVLP